MNRIENANNEYSAGNFEKALPMYMEESDDGNLECTCFAAWMFFCGEGTKQDIRRALELFVIASADGDLESRFGIIRCYIALGEVEKAKEGLLELSNLDYPPANYRLGMAHLIGDHVIKDEILALSYFSRAAKRKHLFSCKQEASLLIKGKRGFFFRLLGMYKFIINIFNAASIFFGKGVHDPRLMR